MERLITIVKQRISTVSIIFKYKQMKAARDIALRFITLDYRKYYVKFVI